VGRTVNSFSGGFNTMTTLAVYAFNIIDMTQSADKNDIVKMATIYNDSSKTIEVKAKSIGIIAGTIFTKIFNVQVPDVQYQVYN
jgi:nicotinate-nucleotide pyrophosphorylase